MIRLPSRFALFSGVVTGLGAGCFTARVGRESTGCDILMCTINVYRYRNGMTLATTIQTRQVVTSLVRVYEV